MEATDEPNSPPSSPVYFSEDAPSITNNLQDEENQEPPKEKPKESIEIWGTKINIKETIEMVKDFLANFQDPNVILPLYPMILEQLYETESTSFNVNCEYLKQHNSRLYEQLLKYPSEIIQIFDEVLNVTFAEEFKDKDPNKELQRLQMRPFNLYPSKPMRELDPEDIDSLVSLKGIVIRVSSIIPEMKEAYFSCVVCQHNEIAVADRGKIVAPQSCPNCKGKNCMFLNHNRCIFSDKQWIKLQETPDNVPEGETPHSVSLFAYGDMVDVVRPGDRVEVTGVWRAVPVRNNSFHNTVRSIFRTYLDTLHFKKSDKNRLGIEDPLEAPESEYFTKMNERDELNEEIIEKERNMKRIAKTGDIYQVLTRSLAPSIWELDDIKKGILCQLFGGTNKNYTEEGIGRFRGDINILLCGDPGTSKSQLLQYVHKLSPRGIYTSGKGSSAVGLTAYVTRDSETKEAVLESGALVLSDRGICCIDEFDKMSDQTRSILHEAMEQQTVSIAKAGIICTLNARTSILASANPRESRYNPRLSVVENIQLPPTLLSRFDLIYLVLDKPDEKTDKKLAAHLISLFYQQQDQVKQTYLDVETLAEYISYAKKKVQPKLSDAAVKDLVEGYANMRKLGQNKKTITATPRQLESLIRISEALARMRLSEIVERSDVAEAIRLVKSAMQQAALDPRTGTIDMDLITTGRSSSSRARLNDLVKELRAILVEQQNSIKLDQLHRMISSQSTVEVPISDLKLAVQLLSEEGFISLGGEFRNPTIRKGEL